MSKLTSLFPQKIKTFFKKFRKFNALNNIDKKLLEHLNYSNGFYIECGANDGINQSNTWYFEKHLNWKGILIEPLENEYKELIINRSKKNYFYNCALVGSKKIKSLKLIKKKLESKIIKNEESNSKVIDVNSQTLTSILEKIKLSKDIDFFSLDVMGFESEVLRGINFKKFKFKFILIATYNNNVLKYLHNKNYKFVKKLTHHDYLFKYKY